MKDNNRKQTGVGDPNDEPDKAPTKALIHLIQRWGFIWGLCAASFFIIWPFVAGSTQVIFLGAAGLGVSCFLAAHKIFESHWRYTLPAIATIPFFVISLVLVSHLEGKDVSRPLKHANEGLVPSTLKADEVIVFLGRCSVTVSSSGGVFPVVVTTIPKPLLSVSMTTKGALVSGQFFDKNGKIVAALKNNKPIINDLNSFDVERPDDSTLVVRDQSNVEVLNIRYLNRSAFAFTGSIRAPDGAEMIVTESEVVFFPGGGRFIRADFGNFAIKLSTNELAVGSPFGLSPR